MRVPAIVGSFPAPFLTGLDGKRRPVRLECDDAGSQPCKDAKDALERVDVPAVELVARGARHRAGDAPGRGAVAARPHRARRLHARGGARGERRVRALLQGRPLARPARRERRRRPHRPRRRRHRAGGGPAPARRRARLARDRHSTRQGLAAGVRALREDELRDAFAVAATRAHRREAAPGVAMTLIPAYRSRPSALHTARAGVGAAFCCSFALVGALYRNPLVLAGAIGGIWLGGDLRRGRARGRPLAAAGAAVRAAHRGGQRARLPGGADRAAPRRRVPRPPLGRHARGDSSRALLTGMRIVVLVAALGG